MRFNKLGKYYTYRKIVNIFKNIIKEGVIESLNNAFSIIKGEGVLIN